ncbi:unnamed protein product [Protopolystoma xenopodis]|uniref:Uncharacterized protein n=1 Tax=Protopolystoma xenopodis TaxID=117903 RepID=A0A3S5AEZ1_9PLAT|nr:unnamed protein product [Protopolystoma xenopodis]
MNIVFTLIFSFTDGCPDTLVPESDKLISRDHNKEDLALHTSETLNNVTSCYSGEIGVPSCDLTTHIIEGGSGDGSGYEFHSQHEVSRGVFATYPRHHDDHSYPSTHAYQRPHKIYASQLTDRSSFTLPGRALHPENTKLSALETTTVLPDLTSTQQAEAGARKSSTGKIRALQIRQRNVWPEQPAIDQHAYSNRIDPSELPHNPSNSDLRVKHNHSGHSGSHESNNVATKNRKHSIGSLRGLLR